MTIINKKSILIVFIIGIVLILFAKKIAPFLSLIDYPDKNLKSHIKPIPSTGGLSIIISIAIGIMLNIQSKITNQHIVVMLFLLGIFLLGILDDRFNLKVFIRLLIQIVLVNILLIFIPPLSISGLFFLDFIISVTFCVACINAMNILDIMDGLAGGVAFFAVLNCLIFLSNDAVFYIVISICTLVSLLSFLIFNFNPATIFMGDAGSTFLGGLIAILTLVVFQQATTIQEKFSYLFPVFVIFFELFFVVIMRTKKGLNPMIGSPDHLPLRIRKLGFSVKKTVLIVYFFAAVCCVLSIVLIYTEFPLVILSIFFVSLLFIGLRMSKIVMD